MSRPEGDIVAVLAGRGPALVVGLLGALASGSAVLPVDPTLPEERQAFMLADCEVQVIVTDSRHRDLAETLAERVPTVKHVVDLDDDANTGPAAESRHVVPEPPADSLCYVIYTSGSTGTPKGVGVTHANLSPLLLWGKSYFGMGLGDRVLQNLNPAFDFGLFEIFTTVCWGAALCFPAEDSREITDYAVMLASKSITILHSTPTFLAELMARRPQLDSLRLVHLGGEELTPALVSVANAALPANCTIHNGYGPTETTINCSIYPVDRGSDGLPGSRIPIGWASANNYLAVVDEALRPLPVGVPGELVVTGGGVTLGYLGQPALTARQFAPSPFGEPGGRLYRSGDLVRRRSDGAFQFLGRLDRQVKLRGYRIDIGEIESVLMRHPDIASAAVLVDSSHVGHDRLVAYLVPASPGSVILGQQVRDLAAKTLPRYMVPASFVIVNRLPTTANGKVDRTRLPAPAPAAERSALDVASLGPQAQLLADLWASVLDCGAVGPEDNFFDLGGDSLLAARITERARAAGIPISTNMILQHQVISKIIWFIESEGMKQVSYSTSLALHIPARNDNAVAVVYGVGHSGSGAAVWNPVGKHAPASIDVRGFRLPGREKRFGQPYFTSVASAAAELAEVISADAAEHGKPVLVMGSCTGALIGHGALLALRGSVNALGLVVANQTPPRLAAREEQPPIDSMTSGELRVWLRDRNLTPAEILDDDELYEALEPTLRVDLLMTDGYFAPQKNLGTPIYLLETAGDELGLDYVSGWQDATSGSAEVLPMPVYGDPLTSHPVVLASALGAVAVELKQASIG
jgi:amino acid adenylation domain-containing protein